MPETFLHGVEIVEVNSGARPIRTVKSSVIGIVGTAPNAQAALAATLTFGSPAMDSAITVTADTVGLYGNGIQLTLSNPGTASATLSVAVVDRHITVSLATDANSQTTSTAAAVLAAINGDGAAGALVTVTLPAGTDGSGVIPTVSGAYLRGGEEEPFPVGEPALIAGSRAEAAKLGTGGTLPAALDGIFDQVGAAVVVVRATVGGTPAETATNVLNACAALLDAQSKLGQEPRILCAPGFTDDVSTGANSVASELISLAERLNAVVFIDGPDTTDAAAISAGQLYGSERAMILDPWFRIEDTVTGEITDDPPSARVAGLQAKVDLTQGFWNSLSNRTINGIKGLTRAIDFKLGDFNSRANILNENNVTTFINYQGFRAWGNRGLGNDPRWHFLSVRRTADMINDSIKRGHMWAVDRNSTGRTYVEDVTGSVNRYLASLIGQDAIIGGLCIANPDLNTPQNIAQGKVFFDFDFGAHYPAEHITFNSHLNNEYINVRFSSSISGGVVSGG